MIFCDIRIALTEHEYALATRLLDRDNRQRERPWEMELYLGGLASNALIHRLGQLAAADLKHERARNRKESP